jgi:hypothetical protein
MMTHVRHTSVVLVVKCVWKLRLVKILLRYALMENLLSKFLENAVSDASISALQDLDQDQIHSSSYSMRATLTVI